MLGKGLNNDVTQEYYFESLALFKVRFDAK